MNPDSPSQSGWGVSAGVIAFNGDRETGTEGTCDCGPWIDGDPVARISEVALGDFESTPSRDREPFLHGLGTQTTTGVADNMVCDSKAVVAGGIVIWRKRGREDEGGNASVHLCRL